MKFTSLAHSLEYNYIKSIPQMGHLNLTPNEIRVIELVHSYQRMGKLFYMNYEDVADYLVIKKGKNKASVAGKIIRTTRDKGYLTIETKHNYNGKNGGSSSTISVNEAFLEEQLHKVFNPENFSDEIAVLENENQHSDVTESHKKNGIHEPKAISYEQIETLMAVNADKTFLEELEELGDETPVKEERYKFLSYDDANDIEAGETKDEELLSYAEIDNVDSFIGLLQRLIRREDLNHKRGAIQYIIEMKDSGNLTLLKEVYEGLVLKSPL